MSLLDLRNVTKNFRGLAAIDDLSFSVDELEIVGLIGPNGSGKTTVFNLITGVYRPDRGSVTFKGEKISGLAPHLIFKKGIARTYQLVRPFAEMSVFDNVLTGILYSGTRTPMKEAEGMTAERLKEVGLERKSGFLAKELTLLEMKKLELAKATIGKPTLVLIDEFFAGLAPPEVAQGIEDIRQLNKRSHMTLVVVEHNMKAVTSIAERVIAISFGKLIAQGTPSEVVKNPAVIEAYLGVKNVKATG